MAKAKGWKTGGDQGRAKQMPGSIGMLSGKLAQGAPKIAKSTTQPSRLKRGK